MKIRTIKKDALFTPKFNKNRDLPNDQQITVHIKSFPTVTEAQGYKSFRMSEGGGFEVVYPNDAIMLTRHIGDIKNIELDTDEVIDDGRKLANTKVLELTELVAEIREYLLEVGTDILDQGEG